MASYRSVLTIAVILLVGSAGAEDPTQKASQAKEDLDHLQGKWRQDEKETLFFHTSWVSEERFPHFEDLVSDRWIEIKGDKLRYGKKLEREITIVLGAAEGKKTISFKHGDNSPIIGIYKLDKGGFRVCAVDPELGGVKEEVRLPKDCARTRGGWFVQFESVEP